MTAGFLFIADGNGHCTGSLFQRKLPGRKFSVYHTIPVEIVLGLPWNFVGFDFGVMASVILHRRRLYLPPACNKKITVFVFSVTHPNLFCKTFPSSLLTLETVFDLFLRGFLLPKFLSLIAKCAYCSSVSNP